MKGAKQKGWNYFTKKVCESGLKTEKMCKIMLDAENVFLSILKIDKVWKSVPKVGKILTGIYVFAVQMPFKNMPKATKLCPFLRGVEVS